jgi:hypothetical protein
MYSESRQIDFAKESKLYWYATSSNTVEVRLENGDAEQYKITDARGSVIRTGRLNNGRSRLQGLPAGTYYMAITGTEPKTIRFVVQ